ncbi:MAG: gluconate 2-dehydrogenase subunit 3 family protein [Spirosomataceae bacterium]
MNRRQLIQRLTVTAGALVSLPAWATSWSPERLPQSSKFLSVTETNTLEIVVDTFIPQTDTPGAKEIGVPLFVETMLQDCYETTDQATAKALLDRVTQVGFLMFGKEVGQLSVRQRELVLEAIEQQEEKEIRTGFRLMKSLIIQGYMSSEYVMTEHTKFEFAPARYLGCVPINQN